MRMQDLGAGAAAVLLAVLLAGCGGSVTSLTDAVPETSSSPALSIESGLVVTGTVVNAADGSPMAGVSVTLGSCQGTSDPNGRFSVKLPSGSTVASVCAVASGTFSLVTSRGTNWQAILAPDEDAAYPVQWIPLPQEVLAGASNSLGVIKLSQTVLDGDCPPPPPTFDD